MKKFALLLVVFSLMLISTEATAGGHHGRHHNGGWNDPWTAVGATLALTAGEALVRSLAGSPTYVQPAYYDNGYGTYALEYAREANRLEQDRLWEREQVIREKARVDAQRRYGRTSNSYSGSSAWPSGRYDWRNW